MNPMFPGRVATISFLTDYDNKPASVHVDQTPNGFTVTTEARYLQLSGRVYTSPASAIEEAIAISGYNYH